MPGDISEHVMNINPSAYFRHLRPTLEVESYRMLSYTIVRRYDDLDSHHPCEKLSTG
jgi:hypothetical protein